MRNLEKPIGEDFLKSAAHSILGAFSRSIEEPGLEKTPERFAKSFIENAENGVTPEELLRSALFEEEYDGMLLEKNITFYSLCEHHLLPFYGTATIAYIPNGRIVGLSKLPRLVRLIALGPNVQERITHQVANIIEKVVQPLGVGVILSANHLCMSSRGVRAEGTLTITSSVRGILKESGTAREEYLELTKITGAL